VEGRVTASDDSGAELDVAGSNRRVEFGDVARARVQVEFRRLDDADEDDGDSGGDDGDEG
jgi:ribosome maturation factor RimP